MIDNSTLVRLRTEGIYYVGVQTNGTGDLYLATLPDFNKAPMLSYEKRGGAMQRYLPLDWLMISLRSVRSMKAW